MFDTDVAAPSSGKTFVPARNFLTANSLEKPWEGFVWMNPPFGGRNGIAPWLRKFFSHGNGIALVPDRTSAAWFQEAWTRADVVLFTPKLKFIRPDGTIGKSPSNGTALLASGKSGAAALHRAAQAKLGILGIPLRPSEMQSNEPAAAAVGAPMATIVGDRISLARRRAPTPSALTLK